MGATLALNGLDKEGLISVKCFSSLNDAIFKIKDNSNPNQKKVTVFFQFYYPVDTGRKLNVHKTFRTRPGRLLNVLSTFNLRPVSTG